MDINEPATEIEIACLLDRTTEFRDRVIIRKLAFQRDKLLEQVEIYKEHLQIEKKITN